MIIAKVMVKDTRFKNLNEKEIEKIMQYKQECFSEYKTEFVNSNSIKRRIDKYCCRNIYVNHCIETKYRLSLESSLFLMPTTDPVCLSHLTNTIKYCNVDTR